MQTLNVGGYTGKSRVSFARPADTSDYAENDVVGPAATGLLVFENVAATGNGSGYITGARLTYSSASIDDNFRLHLYREPITAIADNAANTLLSANMDKYVGYVDLENPVTSGSGSQLSVYQNDQVRLPFHTGYDTGLTDPQADGAARRRLFGVLEILGTHTPGSGDTVTVELSSEQNA